MRTLFFIGLLCLSACKPFDSVTSSPTPTPTVTPGPSASPSPVPSVTPYPSPGSSDGAVPTTCTKVDVAPTFKLKLVQAVQLYRSQHTADITDKFGNQISVTDPAAYILNPHKWNDFYYGVVAIFNDYSFGEAIVDSCGSSGVCGEIAIKGLGVVKGTGFSEQHMLLYSDGRIVPQDERFHGTCTPAWFDK